MSKGIDVRATYTELLIRALLMDANGNLLNSGSPQLYLFELQYSDGSLKTFDFSSNTFKSATCTTPYVAPVAQAGNNEALNTGLWTYRQTTLTGFTEGNIYIASVYHPSANPLWQAREFQWGGDQGDLPMTYGKVDSSTFVPTASAFETNLTVDVTDAYTQAYILFLPGSSLAGQTGRLISSYEKPSTNINGKGKITALEIALSAAPAGGDRFVIIGASA